MSGTNTTRLGTLYPVRRGRTVAFEFVFGCAPAGSQCDDRSDRLVPDLIGEPDHIRIEHRRMPAQGRLDLFGVDLFARRIDAERTAPEEVHAAVGSQLGVVTADRIVLISHPAEHLRRAIRVFEVRE